MNTAKWWRTLDLQTFMRWLDNSDVFADTGVLIRERFPSWMQMQEYTSYAEATWNKKVIQTYNECIVRSYGDPDQSVTFVKIWIRMNVRIYSYQQNYTNEYPNIFMLIFLTRTNVRISIRIENCTNIRIYSNIRAIVNTNTYSDIRSCQKNYYEYIQIFIRVILLIRIYSYIHSYPNFHECHTLICKHCQRHNGPRN